MLGDPFPPRHRPRRGNHHHRLDRPRWVLPRKRRLPKSVSHIVVVHIVVVAVAVAALPVLAWSFLPPTIKEHAAVVPIDQSNEIVLRCEDERPPTFASNAPTRLRAALCNSPGVMSPLE